MNVYYIYNKIINGDCWYCFDVVFYGCIGGIR